jgi:hypothetical protein
MARKSYIILLAGIGFIALISILFVNSDLDFSSNDIKKTKLDIPSLFNIYGFEDQFEMIDGKKTWINVQFELSSENAELYETLMPSTTEKTIVIYPIFTSIAYNEPGFYTYYRGECDEECLTLDISKDSILNFFSSGNAFQVLSLLGYDNLTDIDVDKQPEILEKYDKVILLHNEYVTKKQFDAILAHPNVIYLYPNALYAEVIVDYDDNYITLHRGHGYPQTEIKNGFNWKFDNTHMEYNTNCIDMGFTKISNGWMLNCYPERAIHQSKVLLEMIKEF